MKITKTGRHKNMTIRGDDKRRLIELGSYAAEHHVDFEAWHALSETDEGIREILKRIDANYCVVIDGWRINYTVDRMKEGLFRHLFVSLIDPEYEDDFPHWGCFEPLVPYLGFNCTPVCQYHHTVYGARTGDRCWINLVEPVLGVEQMGVTVN